MSTTTTTTVTPNFSAIFPFIDTTSILNQANKTDVPLSLNEPIDLTKTLKRSRQLFVDQPIDYSVVNKRYESNNQHVAHVFGDKYEKKFKMNEENSVERSIDDGNENDIDDNDDEEEYDGDDNHHHHYHHHHHQQQQQQLLLSSRNKSVKEYDDHRPLTPVSTSSSPQTISSFDKKPILSTNDKRMIRERDRYCCTYCSKTFPRSANLTRHLRTHTDKYLK